MNAPTLAAQPQSPPMYYQAFTMVLSPAQVATIVAAEQTFTPPANIILPANAIVLCSGPAINGAIAPCYYRRAGATSIGITWVNPTAGPVTPTASALYNFVIIAPLS